MVTVIFGDMKTKIQKERLELIDAERTGDDVSGQGEALSKMDKVKANLQSDKISHVTQETIDEHKKNFQQDLDIRGFRGNEALQAVQYFIDDAILMSVSRVRILHGKGNGILRQLVRQYLSSEPNVRHYADEHVQFGGAGITVVELG